VTLYLSGGEDSPPLLERVGIYNVGNGTISAYDNIYVGDPYAWQVVVPEPSIAGLLAAALGLTFVRRRKR
jgi:hypothetical protein